MSLLNIETDEVPNLPLTRDVSKHLKRGHRWVFANCFDEKQKFVDGLAILSFKKEALAIGIVQKDTQLKFRVLTLCDEPWFRKNSLTNTLRLWSQIQWQKLIDARKVFDLNKTNSFRLCNGEGDGMPGLIIDIYNSVAVIKHDHPHMEKIWNHQNLVAQLREAFPQLTCVYLKRKNKEEEKGVALWGALPAEVQFLENDLFFASNIRDAAKTGFFLDQRDNRQIIRQFAKDKKVLNLFSYTGGFSIYAAAGGAQHVTSVDIAKVAIEAVQRNFEINNLRTAHEDIAIDAFKFVETEIQKKSLYDLVITDPPSFAPNEKSVPQATAAYIKIFADSLKLVKPQGLFAASSCSSHIHHPAFLEICKEAFSKARKKGTVLYIGGQPSDHPFPLAMEELRYLKFILFRVD
ncbi:MAG: class I SAM-dependent rRNA methyltransferase [Bdellovibrionia bacterium]